MKEGRLIYAEFERLFLINLDSLCTRRKIAKCKQIFEIEGNQNKKISTVCGEMNVLPITTQKLTSPQPFFH